MKDQRQHSAAARDLTQILSSVPYTAWEAAQVIILDWHDSPREGVCLLAKPACSFYFRLVAESPQSDMFDGLFRISTFGVEAFHELASLLAVLGPRTTPSWVPIWRFTNEQLEEHITQGIQHILESVENTDVVVRTCDMLTFQGYWLQVNSEL